MPEEKEIVEYEQLPVKCLTIEDGPGAVSPAPHWHSRLELLLIDEGSLQVTVDGQNFTALPGDTVCICPRCSHEGRAGESGVKYRVVMFEVSLMEDSLPATGRYIRPLLTGVARLNPHIRDKAIADEIDALTEEYLLPDPSSLLLEGQMYRLLGLLFRRHTDSAYAPRPVDRRLAQAIDYIDAHFTEPLSLAQLTALFNYEESYFCRRFRQQTGLNLIAYIHSLRLNQAVRLLTETDLTVEEIGARCGYDSASYFIRRFRRQYGVSPRQWRHAGLG